MTPGRPARMPATSRLTRMATVLYALLAGVPASAATLTLQVADTAGKALQDAVVYAMPAAGKAPVKPAKAVIDQVNRDFAPLVSVVPTGTAVSFPNKDNIRHQVYSFSPAKTFELRLYSGTQAPPVTFDKPGLVTLGCNIHDHMIAYAYVVDTPWFAKTDVRGGASLEGLPPGDYILHAWHYRQTGSASFSRPFSIKSADAAIAVGIEVKAAIEGARHH